MLITYPQDLSPQHFSGFDGAHSLAVLESSDRYSSSILELWNLKKSSLLSLILAPLILAHPKILRLGSTPSTPFHLDSRKNKTFYTDFAVACHLVKKDLFITYGLITPWFACFTSPFLDSSLRTNLKLSLSVTLLPIFWISH